MRPTDFSLQFTIKHAERGGFILEEYVYGVDELRRYICPDTESLFAEMRAWTERHIEELRCKGGNK